MRVGALPATRFPKRVTWFFSLLAILSLPLAWIQWSSARYAGAETEAAQERQAAQALSLRATESLLQTWSTVVSSVVPTRERLSALGETPLQWESQTINLENQAMSRHEAERYLQDLQGNADRVLVLSAFNLRSTDALESVFAAHQGLDRAGALMLTVKGELFTRKTP